MPHRPDRSTALANPLDKFELGIRKLIEDLMIVRMGENDTIVTRYMADQEFQGSVFPILAREIFEAVRKRSTLSAGAEQTAGSEPTVATFRLSGDLLAFHLYNLSHEPRPTARSIEVTCAAAVNCTPTICADNGTTRSAGAGFVKARSVRMARATPSFTNRTSLVSPSWFVLLRRTVTSTLSPAVGVDHVGPAQGAHLAAAHAGHPTLLLWERPYKGKRGARLAFRVLFERPKSAEGLAPLDRGRFACPETQSSAK